MFTKYVDKYLAGESAISLIRKYSLPQDRFYKHLSSIGVKRTMSEAHRTYDLAEDSFNVIKNEKSAYFLGLLFADGTLSIKETSIRISLKESDFKILEELKEFIKYTGPIKKRKYSDKNSRWSDQLGLNIYNKIMVEDLLRLGMIPNKSLTLKFPIIKDNLLKHFIRGYFDGDGCLYIYPNNKRFNLTITGSKYFINSLRGVLKNKFGFNGFIFSRHNNDCLTYMLSGERQIMIFLNWIYKDAGVFIQRKWYTYREVLKIRGML